MRITFLPYKKAIHFIKTMRIDYYYDSHSIFEIGILLQGRKGAYREPETQRNARPFGSSMAEWQRFGCIDNWPCNCKQTPSLGFPIDFHRAHFIHHINLTFFVNI